MATPVATAKCSAVLFLRALCQIPGDYPPQIVWAAQNAVYSSSQVLAPSADALSVVVGGLQLVNER